MAGLQTITTPVTGTAISSTTFGIPVATDINVLANPPLAKMTNSTGISITNNTPTMLTWDTETFDTVNGHSTVTNTSRYVAQTGYAGYYQVRATVVWAANATGVRFLCFYVNGAQVPASGEQILCAAATILSINAETTVFLNAADYVEVSVTQTSGGALSTSQATGLQSRFEVEWVHQ